MHKPSWHHKLRAFTSTNIPSEELEALSRRYSSATVMLLPLASGRVALFDNARVFRLIADESDLTHATLLRLSSEWEQELRAQVQHVERLRSMGLVEPDAKRLARDIHKAEQRTLPSDFVPPELDLESI